MIFFEPTSILGSIAFILLFMVICSKRPLKMLKIGCVAFIVIILIGLAIQENKEDDANIEGMDYLTSEADSKELGDIIPDSLTYDKAVATLDSLGYQVYETFYTSVAYEGGWLAQGIGIRQNRKIYYYLFFNGTPEKSTYDHAEFSDLESDKMIFNDSKKSRTFF